MQRWHISEAMQRDRKPAWRLQGECAQLAGQFSDVRAEELFSIYRSLGHRTATSSAAQLGDSMLRRCATLPRQYSGVGTFVISISSLSRAFGSDSKAGFPVGAIFVAFCLLLLLFFIFYEGSRLRSQQDKRVFIL